MTQQHQDTVESLRATITAMQRQYEAVCEHRDRLVRQAAGEIIVDIQEAPGIPEGFTVVQLPLELYERMVSSTPGTKDDKQAWRSYIVA